MHVLLLRPGLHSAPGVGGSSGAGGGGGPYEAHEAVVDVEEVEALGAGGYKNEGGGYPLNLEGGLWYPLNPGETGGGLGRPLETG